MMTFIPSPSPLARRPIVGLAMLFALIAAVFGVQAIIAQVSGDRGIAPLASSTDVEIGGIEVDVTGDNAEDARDKGWKLAQRKAWEKMKGPAISDSQLQGMVSAVVIEKEQIGARRYVATLGVVFDRARSGTVLGAGGARARSAPMLTIPVLVSGGSTAVFEYRNPWQRAWAEYQTGASAIDYVRPSGAGGESLLLNFGQTGRRSRVWWRNILDEFGAASVIIPTARLERQWPGGPITGHFTARYSPDNRYLASFDLRAENEQQLGEMLDEAIERFDGIFTQALRDGKLTPDPTLRADRVNMDPAIAALIEAGRRAQAAERAAASAAAAAEKPDETTAPVASTATESAVVSNYVVQFATPDAGAVDQGLASVRSAPGVRGAATSSIAIGGTSVMRVSFAGSIDQLAAALRARGWQVNQGSNALAISR